MEFITLRLREYAEGYENVAGRSYGGNRMGSHRSKDRGKAQTIAARWRDRVPREQAAEV